MRLSSASDRTRRTATIVSPGLLANNPLRVNTDRALVLEFLQGDHKPVAITSNPLARELGAELIEADATHGIALLAFTPPADFVQGAQVLQGGIVATLLDFAMAFAAHARLAAEERAFSTATLTVSLMRAAPAGRYLARGRIVRSGARLMFAEADLTSASGESVARASAVMPFI
jgi:uncharacterized protein (TIGR00369 family)